MPEEQFEEGALQREISSLGKKPFFSGKPKQVQPEYAEFSSSLNELSRDIKVLEERYTGIRRKTQLMEQNSLSTSKRISSDIKAISADMNEIKSSLIEIATKLKDVREEIAKCAKKDELKILDKYVSYWEPLNYVTAKDVERIAEEVLARKKVPAEEKED